MRYLKASAILLATSGLAPVAAAPAFAQEAQAEPVRYSAEAFFDTTSYIMAAPAGYGFSADGKSILISNDSSGVFNAYALPVAGGAPVAVSRSPDNATFAASFFLLMVNYGWLAVTEIPEEERSPLFLVRLLAFGLIIVAIFQSNREEPS